MLIFALLLFLVLLAACTLYPSIGLAVAVGGSLYLFCACSDAKRGKGR